MVFPSLDAPTPLLALALRARLASFAHAYALAVRLRESTGADQFVIRTASPMQPVRVSPHPPECGEVLLAVVG